MMKEGEVTCAQERSPPSSLTSHTEIGKFLERVLSLQVSYFFDLDPVLFSSPCSLPFCASLTTSLRDVTGNSS